MRLWVNRSGANFSILVQVLDKYKSFVVEDVCVAFNCCLVEPLTRDATVLPPEIIKNKSSIIDLHFIYKQNLTIYRCKE